MATIVRNPSTFTSGTAIVASQMNTTLNTIYNEFNGNIDSENIKDLGISNDKLQAITTANKVNPSAITNGTSIATVELMVTFDNAGTTIETTAPADTFLIARVPFAVTLTGYYILNDVSSTINCELEYVTYANFAGGDSDTWTGTDLTGGNDIAIAVAAVKGTDTTLSGWTTALTAGWLLRFKMTTCSAATRTTIVLTGTRA